MRPFSLLIAGLLLFPVQAGAQVIINQAALNQLAGIAPPVIAAPPAIRQAPRRVSDRRIRPARIGSAHRLIASRMIAKAAPQPATPQPAVQPVVAKPVIPPAPPKPVLPQPAIITFAAGGADLPGNVTAALQPFCAHAAGIITIDAYAAANPADPSEAPRLSMRRAFAIRDALTACGVPSGNIIPRANGAAKTTTPDAAEVSASP